MGLFDWMNPRRERVRALATTTPRTSVLADAMDRARASRLSLRRYEGAVVDRLTSSWMTANVAIDDELRRDLDRLRARSRDLFKNNEHAAKFARLVRNNVVGPEGFTLHARAAQPDGTRRHAGLQGDRGRVLDWCKPRNCDITGRRAFVDLVRVAVTSMARDGEFLIKRVRNAGKYGYQLQRSTSTASTRCSTVLQAPTATPSSWASRSTPCAAQWRTTSGRRPRA
jgi:capsid protein